MKLDKNISDKVYWHKYIEFYEKHLPGKLNSILEIGVFNGDSIRFWREKYSLAYIYGIDIIAENENWPFDSNIKYFQLDQSNVIKYKQILNKIDKKFDLIIEDGSHDPMHQKISLIESLEYLKNGSIYILEDIHTSHISHPYYKRRLDKFNKENNSFFSKKTNILMPLQCLLMIDHFKSNNINIEEVKTRINLRESLFSYKEIELLYHTIKKINIFKRTVLPDYCYSCKTDNFDFINLKCNCGTDLYSESDSITALLEF